ncbi:MAG: helix-turn-helix transcriptional regulator [Geobacter sp.]
MKAEHQHASSKNQVKDIGDPVLRPRRACAYLDISRATLYRLIQAGKLPPPLKLSTQARGWRLSVLNSLLSDAEAK